MTVVLYKNNTSPAITDTITINGVAVNLTGAAVRLQARLASSQPGATLVIDQSATIVSPTLGTIQYVPVAGDTAVAYSNPPLVGWWHITLAGGAIQDAPEFPVYILDHAEATTSDLTTLTEVRATLELPANDTKRDLRIQQEITAASQAIMRYCDREFAPASTAVTRRFGFPVEAGMIPLVIPFGAFDLRTATTVVINPESVPTTLTAETDYVLNPATPTTGTYKQLTLSRLRVYSTYSQHWTRYGRAYIDVTGNWGFATVPNDVNRACRLTVAAWIDSAISGYGAQDSMIDSNPRVIGGGYESAYGLPLGACRMLKSYRTPLLA